MTYNYQPTTLLQIPAVIRGLYVTVALVTFADLAVIIAHNSGEWVVAKVNTHSLMYGEWIDGHHFVTETAAYNYFRTAVAREII